MSGVSLIDCDYHLPRYAGAYLAVNRGKALFVDNNTSHSIPLLMAELANSGLTPSDVEFIIITHVHLDHAGGTSALLKRCPNATVLAHPRAAPHLIDPGKLITSAKQVYGEEKFSELYGVIEPIPTSRVRSLEDDESLPFGDGMLRFIHTRGHANHHFCILYESPREPGQEHREESAIFTGDAFGIAYPDLQTNGLFIFPSTSPTDFDADEARASIRKIFASGATEALLTHFGSVTDLEAGKEQLLLGIDRSEKILQDAVSLPIDGEALQDFCLKHGEENMRAHAAASGLAYDGATKKILEVDLDLNAQGLAYRVLKERAKEKASADLNGRESN